MKAFVTAIALVALSAPLTAQWLNQPTQGIPRTPDGKPDLTAPAPRTPDGKPDLSGLWNKISPKYSRNVAADLKPGEIQPWARALVEERRENLGKDYMNVRCLPLGPGYAISADSTGAEMMKMIQTPALIVILNPDLTYRQIFLDGRALESAPNPAWMGYSVGRWEGDTLVVESNGFNDRTWLDHDGHPHTEGLRTTERYRRRNFGNLDLEVTFNDPGTYARPWTVAVRAELTADTEMIEWVCNEGKSGLDHWVGKASDERRGEVQVAPAILSKYVGTYHELRAVLANGGQGGGDRAGRRKAGGQHGRPRPGAALRHLGCGLYRPLRARRRVHRRRRGRAVREARLGQLPLRAEVGLVLISGPRLVTPGPLPGSRRVSILMRLPRTGSLQR